MACTASAAMVAAVFCTSTCPPTFLLLMLRAGQLGRSSSDWLASAEHIQAYSTAADFTHALTVQLHPSELERQIPAEDIATLTDSFFFTPGEAAGEREQQALDFADLVLGTRPYGFWSRIPQPIPHTRRTPQPSAYPHTAHRTSHRPLHPTPHTPLLTPHSIPHASLHRSRLTPSLTPHSIPHSIPHASLHRSRLTPLLTPLSIAHASHTPHTSHIPHPTSDV